jgi:hypothetical protein
VREGLLLGVQATADTAALFISDFYIRIFAYINRRASILMQGPTMTSLHFSDGV